MKVIANENKIIIEIENTDNIDLSSFKDYINSYNEKKVVVSHNNELLQIDINDIIIFYSDKKYNYCKTKTGDYKVKNKLYELEKYSNDFIRISKRCIVNVNHIVSFDMGESGKIIVNLDNEEKEIVSRRKIKDVINYLDEREI